MEDHFALQDKREASRSSITYTSLVSPTHSNWLSLSEDTTTATSKPSPSSDQLLPPIAGHHTLPRSRSSSIANSEISREHGSESKHRANSVRSTHKNGDTEGEARKGKKTVAKKFSMDVIDGFFNGKKRARSCSATLPNPIGKGKDQQISSTSPAGTTLSLGRCADGYRGPSRSNSLIVTPASRHQIRSELSNILEQPIGPLLTPHHRLLKMKLAPLATIESQLLDELSIPAEDEVVTHCPCPLGRPRDRKELIVRPLRGWEEKFGRLRIGTPKWLREEPKFSDPGHIISAW
jgi:hypothetical protein